MKYQIKMDVDNIVNMSGTVQEKQAALNDLRYFCRDLFDKAEEQIYKDYKYCEKCDRWYHIRAWEHNIEDDGNGYGKIVGDICPLGHYIKREKGEEEDA